MHDSGSERFRVIVTFGRTIGERKVELCCEHIRMLFAKDFGHRFSWGDADRNAIQRTSGLAIARRQVGGAKCFGMMSATTRSFKRIAFCKFPARR